MIFFFFFYFQLQLFYKESKINIWQFAIDGTYSGTQEKVQKICISVTHTHLVINMCTLLKGKQSLNDIQS